VSPFITGEYWLINQDYCTRRLMELEYFKVGRSTNFRIQVMINELVRSNVPECRVAKPLPADLGYCVVIDDFLSAAECEAYIDRAETTGFQSASPDYPPSYRNNDRVVVDDTALAATLFQRLETVASSDSGFICSRTTDNWFMESVNTRMRFCRYTNDQQFNIHQDGVHHRTPDWRSMLTFMIYLNDGSEFSGGDTLFYAHAPRTNPDTQPVIARVRPKKGTLILFDHGIWHAGETVTDGTKYIMRSDVLFRRDLSGACTSSTAPRLEHQGYVWTLARLNGGRFASGGRDCTIRLWNGMGRCTGQLAGHTQSVLGLARIDEHHLASVSRDRTLRTWNLETMECTHVVTAHDAAVLSVTTLGQSRLATGSADHKIKVWNIAGEELATIQAHSGWVWKIVRVNDHLMASASEDGSVKLWSTDTFEMVACLESSHALRTVAASPDGTKLTTGDITGRVRVWKDLHTQPALEAEFIAHGAAIRCIHFIDDRTLATGSEDCGLKIWRDWPPKLHYESQHENFVTDVIAFDADHGASCSYDGKMAFHIWR
jgi:predicted 2-oxoglutarate/Fe(II)-dependent dioxygenase YbiX